MTCPTSWRKEAAASREAVFSMMVSASDRASSLRYLGVKPSHVFTARLKETDTKNDDYMLA